MIAPINPGQPEPRGGLGGIADERNQAAAIVLVRRAIRNDWPLTDAMRQLVVNQMALVVGRSEDNRAKVAAAKVLVAADSINAKREADDLRAEQGPGGDVNVQIGVGLNVAQASSDPEYLEFLRVQRLAGLSDSAADGQHANGRGHLDAEPPSEAGPGDNGHTGGNGRH